MSRLVIEMDELIADSKGLTSAELGGYLFMLGARAYGGVIDVAEIERLAATEGVWMMAALKGLVDKGKLVIRDDGTIDVAERRQRQLRRSGEPV